MFHIKISNEHTVSDLEPCRLREHSCENHVIIIFLVMVFIYLALSAEVRMHLESLIKVGVTTVYRDLNACTRCPLPPSSST